MSILRKIPNPVFLSLLTGSVALAWVVPDWGRSGGYLQAEKLIPAGILYIFLAQGLLLPLSSVGKELRSWQTHLLTQGIIFLGIPLLTMGLLLVFGKYLEPDLRLGLLFLSVLPTTIATAVIFTNTAGGAVTTALFNTVTANVAGVVVVPFAMAYLASATTGMGIDPWPVLQRISLLILLPLFLGIILQNWLHDWATRHGRTLRRLQNGVIFFTVFSVFSDSVADGFWREQGWHPVLVALLATTILLVVVHGGLGFLCRSLPWPLPERIAVFFCASQKTIAAGVPMAHVLFLGVADATKSPHLGMLLLPLMFYHFLQLVVGGVIAERWGQRMHPQATHPPPAPPAKDNRPSG